MKSNRFLKNILPEDVTKELFQEIVKFVITFPVVEQRRMDVSIQAVAENVAAWLFETDTNFVMQNEDGEIVGVFLNTVQGQWWTSTPSLVNTIAYVLPEYRDASAFKAMLQKAEEYAKIKGMKFYFSPVACNKLDVKKRLMRGLGYTEVGAIMEAPV
jgi:GNAT superfamily N-acetyltransferase